MQKGVGRHERLLAVDDVDVGDDGVVVVVERGMMRLRLRLRQNSHIHGCFVGRDVRNRKKGWG